MLTLSKLDVQTRPSSFAHDPPALPFGGSHSLGLRCALQRRPALAAPRWGDLTWGGGQCLETASAVTAERAAQRAPSGQKPGV